MSQAPAGRGTVLVIDNDPNVRWFVSRILRPRGYDVLPAASGIEGLKLLQTSAQRIDLLVLDLNMPDMGGLEMLKAVRKHHPDTQVIVVSAAVEKKDECLLHGAEIFIPKPYNLEEFCRCLESVVDLQ